MGQRVDPERIEMPQIQGVRGLGDRRDGDIREAGIPPVGKRRVAE